MNTLKKNAIYQGNSLDLIQDVENESVHLILSDIPYGIGTDEWDILHNNSNSAYLGSSDSQKKLALFFTKEENQ